MPPALMFSATNHKHNQSLQLLSVLSTNVWSGITGRISLQT